MDLKVTDVAAVLQVSKKTIYRWITDNKIPYYRINHQYRFKTDEINEWAIHNNSIPQNVGTDIISDQITSLHECIKKGGIYYHVSGNNIYEAISNSINLINIPPNIERSYLSGLILKREKEKCTAIKEGIAFPHPGIPIIQHPVFESISICFLHEHIRCDVNTDFKIHTLFIILAASQVRHMHLLAKLNNLSLNNEFITLLKKQPLREELLEYFSLL